MSIDLNADVGEGMDDAALLPYVTSANVACGLHAGDPSVMDDTVTLALSRGVRVGAHPGYADREHFGRVPVHLPVGAIEALVLYQCAALDGFAGRVSDSGEARWTLEAAIDEGVPADGLGAALFGRFTSRGEADFQNRLLSAMRYGFGGHVEKSDRTR